jgi:hypothetical protein
MHGELKMLGIDKLLIPKMEFRLLPAGKACRQTGVLEFE